MHGRADKDNSGWALTLQKLSFLFVVTSSAIPDNNDSYKTLFDINSRGETQTQLWYIPIHPESNRI